MVNTEEDRRNWSFAKRALTEIPPQKPHHKRKHHRWLSYWAVVELPNGQRKAYQLSKDLQHAVQVGGIKEACYYLINSVIVVPISRYEKGGTAQMSLGKILFIFRNPHSGNPRWITRGQFVKPTYNWLGYPHYQRMYNYLRHDYDQASQYRIKQALRRLIRPHWLRKR